jgi:hypothetical protein
MKEQKINQEVVMNSEQNLAAFLLMSLLISGKTKPNGDGPKISRRNRDK